jgi:non-ribosomal peptide synthetase component F
MLALVTHPPVVGPSWDACTVGALFAEQAARTPDTEAVVSSSVRRSYAELDADVDRVARFLVERGVGREVHVGVLLPRSYQLVVALLAVLKAGGVYVPLNPSQPDVRLAALMQDTRPGVVLSLGSLTGRLADLGQAAGTTALSVEMDEVLHDGTTGTVADRHATQAAAYVIQTSGSTGRPKSVQVEMHSLVNLLRWCRDACGVDSGSRVLQVIASSFDASIRSYLTPLVTGAALVLYEDGPYDPEALLGWIERERISVFNPAVPSMFHPVLELAAKADFRALRSLRCLALGAEPPDLSALRRWIGSENFGARVLNVYGPTEATDIACYAELVTDG